MDVHRELSRRAGACEVAIRKRRAGAALACADAHASTMATGAGRKAVIVTEPSGRARALARRPGRAAPIEYDCRIMPRKPLLDPRRVREEIALAAARLIAEDGLDYASAKRKAARHLLGESRIAGEWLPDNDLIEAELHEYLALFQGDTQPAELERLRRVALDWMERLAPFSPYLAGAVLNGTANAHSDIHLQTFSDNQKEVAIYLLNQNIQYDVSETRHFAGRGDVETLSFLWRERRDSDAIGIHVALYDSDDLRGALRADARGRLARADAAALRALMAAPANPASPSTSIRSEDEQ